MRIRNGSGARRARSSSPVIAGEGASERGRPSLLDVYACGDVAASPAFHLTFDGKHNANVSHEGPFTTSAAFFCPSGSATDVEVDDPTLRQHTMTPSRYLTTPRRERARTRDSQPRDSVGPEGGHASHSSRARPAGAARGNEHQSGAPDRFECHRLGMPRPHEERGDSRLLVHRPVLFVGARQAQ